MRSERFLILAILAVLGMSACGGKETPSSSTSGNPVTGVFSITSSPRQVPPATDADRHDALLMAYNVGVRGQYISLRWSELEPSPGVYNLQPISDTLNFLRSVGTFSVLIGIQTINTNQREIPPDIGGLSFDDPIVIARFNQMLDALIPVLGSQTRFLSIGNEVDVYLSAHPSEWSQYKSFVDAAATHARALNPQLSVGATTTFDGASSNASLVASLNSSTDVYIFTYYPLNADFSPRSASTASPDFARMLELSARKQIVLQEVGYPTSTLLGSSEAAQSTFFGNVFDTWQANSSHFLFLNIYLLHDPTQAECDAQSAYYGISAPNFNALVCSLGLRKVDGTPKMAWTTITNKAKSVGLPVTP